LVISLSSAQAGIFDFFDDLDLPAADEIYQQKECSQETRNEAACNVAPYSGVFVCRKYFSFFLWESEHTVCAKNVAEGVTLGMAEDTCGCCQTEAGAGCPQECPCECGDADEDGIMPSVMIQPVIFGDRRGPAICAPKGVARHATAWGGRVVCAEECSALEMGDETDAPSEGF